MRWVGSTFYNGRSFTGRLAIGVLACVCVGSGGSTRAWADAPAPDGMPTSAAPAGKQAPCRQELWMVNTRQAPNCGDLAEGQKRIRFLRLERGGWVSHSREEFLASADAQVPTTFFVHGTFVSERVANRVARRFEDEVSRGVSSYRLVVWSWPSEWIPTKHPRENFRIKMARSEAQAWYLASLLDEYDPRVGLTLAGHSLGCRTVAAALEGLVSRQANGQSLGPPKHTEPRRIQAALVAGAMDPRWLWPGQRYGRAVGLVERMVITFNPRDRLMRSYARVVSPSVMGRIGMPQPWRFGDDRRKLRVVNVQSSVRRAHRLTKFLRTPLVAQWRPYFFYIDALPELEEAIFEETPP